MAQTRAGTAFGIALFVTGLVIWFVNPPSLSGAGGLASLILGSTAFILGAAWLTVRMMGPDALPEEEFERIVQRSETLAARERARRAMGADPDRELTEFEQIVADAIDRLPEDFQKLLEDTPVIVSNRGAENRAYGHYWGDSIAGGRFERKIIIYEDTLVRDYGRDPELLRAQVERTLRHEVAHHLGWNEHGVRGLGL